MFSNFEDFDFENWNPESLIQFDDSMFHDLILPIIPEEDTTQILLSQEASKEVSIQQEEPSSE